MQDSVGQQVYCKDQTGLQGPALDPQHGHLSLALPFG